MDNLVLRIWLNLQAKKKPKLFWVAAIAPLTSVILATLFSFIFKVNKHGVNVVTHLSLQQFLIISQQSHNCLEVFCPESYY